MYFETCRPMPPSGTLSVTCLGSGAKAQLLEDVLLLVLPSLEEAGSSRPAHGGDPPEADATLPCEIAALTSSMNQLLEPFGVSGPSG